MLLVKCIPATFLLLDDASIQDYFAHFGAATCRKLKTKSVVLEFNSNLDAELARQRLSDVSMLGSKLSVAFPKQNVNESKQTEREPDQPRRKSKDNPISIDSQTKDDFTPISKRLGLKYPKSPLLEYKYPPPTPETIANISKAILTIPKLYTQVLHLMNKMNLPPPFAQEEKKKRKVDDLVASDESELEDEVEIKPVTSSSLKKFKTGEKVIQIKNVVSKEESHKRLTVEEIQKIPSYKNYSIGTPSKTLYVKNLAKNITIEHLRTTFQKYSSESTGLQIQLLKKGKLKDQAFVKFNSIQESQAALENENGVYLLGKPLVLQYSNKQESSQENSQQFNRIVNQKINC
ncbi:hypothetical protein HK098_005770 [Nowakowskiella sp. JEL0407]|nr:hypothetical protein HK098_005770 [Nowakowskiella sp. JEL0407]